MTDLVACACGLDPAAETMAAQAGIAAVLSAPFIFRAQLAAALRRLRGTESDANGDDCGGEDDPAEPG